MNILDLIAKESGYHFRRKTVKECAGPCPFCKAGKDRFIIWPTEDRYWCRQCGKSGDAIEFMREFRLMTFHEAVAYLKQLGFSVDLSQRDAIDSASMQVKGSTTMQPILPPEVSWRERGWDFVFDCQQRLMEVNENPRARQWLNDQRGLTDETLWQYGIGYWPENRNEDPSRWGLIDRSKKVRLPKGIVIPWTQGNELGGIRIRRPVGQPKYYWIPGGTGASLYGADLLTTQQPAVLVEGEFDALTIRQEASDLVVAVATGSTMGARRVKWLARLALAPLVLVAFDADSPGEQASNYWLDALENARRWRPYWDDASSLAHDGADIKAWIQKGVEYYLSKR